MKRGVLDSLSEKGNGSGSKGRIHGSQKIHITNKVAGDGGNYAKARHDVGTLSLKHGTLLTS